MTGRSRRPRGVALITALVIVAVTTAAAVSMAARSRLETARVANQLNDVANATLVARIENKVADVLTADALAGRYDAADDAWALSAVSVSDGLSEASATVRDAQRLFNINNLVMTARLLPGGAGSGSAPPDNEWGNSATPATEPGAPSTDAVEDASATRAPPAQITAQGDAFDASAEPEPEPAEYEDAPVYDADADAADDETLLTADSATTVAPEELAAARFALLLDALEIDSSIVQPILDWLDADSDTRFPNGAEDAYYLKLDTPYRSANRPLSDISELLLVRGMTQEIYRTLAPYLAALPTHTEINVNSAPLPILMSLSPLIDRRAAELIMRMREVQAFQSMEDFLDLPPIAFSGMQVDGLSVHSQYFEVTTEVTSANGVTQARTLLGRAANGTVEALSRRTGFFDE